MNAHRDFRSAPPSAPPRLAVAGAGSLGAHAFAVALLIGPYLQFRVQNTDDPIGIATELYEEDDEKAETSPSDEALPPGPSPTAEPAPATTGAPPVEQTKPQAPLTPQPAAPAKGESPDAAPDPKRKAEPDEDAQLPPKGGIEAGKQSGKSPTPIVEPVPPPPERFRPTGLAGRHGVIRVQLGASGVPEIEETLSRSVDAADQYKLFLAGSDFVASRDFRRIALVFLGSLNARPAFLAAELVEDKDLWTTRINRPKVFEDREIRIGTFFARHIDEMLSVARCVVVLWTPSSVLSGWVHAEVSKAEERGVLVPAIVGENVSIPLPFNTLTTYTLPADREKLLSDLRARLAASREAVEAS